MSAYLGIVAKMLRIELCNIADKFKIHRNNWNINKLMYVLRGGGAKTWTPEDMSSWVWFCTTPLYHFLNSFLFCIFLNFRRDVFNKKTAIEGVFHMLEIDPMRSYGLQFRVAWFDVISYAWNSRPLKIQHWFILDVAMSIQYQI